MQLKPACYKVYSGFSARRFMTDMRTAQEDGYVNSAMHFNSVLNFLENPALTPILKEMIVEASFSTSSFIFMLHVSFSLVFYVGVLSR